ncbi:MAG TPA: NAD-dependent protein deacylase [Candidatus Omnitrophota bacterium]|nr:NAD-dependent protein deacylase [Candidatus Omnitrophota bacterium]HQO58032.1 NAD-dependent protein deacylase [Candidatus Omnitrophota bacterium]HQP11206.1 NAD-dependent protein deacylase [Candidatus Omnitrophota bacterium]
MQENLAQHRALEQAAGFLKTAKSVLFITGAGISAESGLPTYRGLGGMYNNRLTEDGIPIETALAGVTLQRSPEVTWKYLVKLEERCRGAAFNPAHRVIANIERRWPRVWVLTQNIDGFHRDAGSKNVIEIHGNIHRVLCASCGFRQDVRDFSGIAIPPLCRRCGHKMRPDVVLFGEMLPPAAVTTLIAQMEQGFDLYFSIGTTSVFPYIRRPLEDAKSRGRFTVEINPEETEASSLVDVRISSGAVNALMRIWDLVTEA